MDARLALAWGRRRCGWWRSAAAPSTSCTPTARWPRRCNSAKELRFAFDNGGTLTGFAGASGFWERGSQRVPFSTEERGLFALLAGQPIVTANGSANLSITNSPQTGAPFKTSHTEQYQNFSQTTAAELFADATYKLSRLSPTNGRKEGTGVFRSAVGRAIANYDFGGDYMGYASFSKGRRPHVVVVNAAGVRPLNEETVLSTEGGLKGQFAGGRAQFDVNAFNYRYSNFQTSITRLTPMHSYSAGFSLDDTKRRFGQLYLSPNSTYRGKVFFEDTNLPAISEKGQLRFNLRAGLRLPDDRTEFPVITRNLFDQQYIIDAGNTGGAFGIPTFIAGAPRFITVQLSRRF